MPRRSPRAPPCSSCPRASSHRSARCPARTSPSASTHARSAASADPATPPTRSTTARRSSSASLDGIFATQLQRVLRKAGFDASTTADVAGVELAGTAKNAAALAAAVAGVSGPNAAGAAAGKVFAEIDAFARTQGADPETFAGLAGAGDLVATVVAEGSRNRRAGELLGQGMPAASIGDELGQSSEALEGVALLAQTLHREGVPSPTLDRLVALVDGRIDPEAFTAHVTAPGGQRSERPQAPVKARSSNGAHRNGSDDVALAGVAGDPSEAGRRTRRG